MCALVILFVFREALSCLIWGAEFCSVWNVFVDWEFHLGGRTTRIGIRKEVAGSLSWAGLCPREGWKCRGVERDGIQSLRLLLMLCLSSGSTERWLLVLSIFSPFYAVQDLAQGMALSVFKMGLPTLINSVKMISQRHVQWLFPWLFWILLGWQSTVLITLYSSMGCVRGRFHQGCCLWSWCRGDSHWARTLDLAGAF